MTTGFITSNGLKLYYKIEGEGHSLVLLNGGPGFSHESLQALRALSHRFLSVTQNIGATQLSALCETLERQARAQDLPAALPLLPQLAQERDRAHAALLAVRMRY